ncbi:MAG: hypothetical protein JHD16_01190 [Solirubrobacteraceae bacterium]|nr:hypothetical protein [Solirubrobacteraceae bacterium]
MTDLAAAGPGTAPFSGGEIVAALDALEHAARACSLATSRWRDAATALDDPQARAVAVATAERSLARSDELLALLALLADVGASSGRPTLTVGAVLGRAAGGVASRYPSMVVRERSEIATQRRTLAPAQAAALTVAVCGALGNAARHGPPDATVSVRATTRGRALSVIVTSPGGLPGKPLIPGRGITSARELVEDAGGTYRVQDVAAGVVVDVTVPLAARWPTPLPKSRLAAGPKGAASGVLARTVLRIQGTHGMAAPLREAQWLVPGHVSECLRTSLDRLEQTAAELAAVLPSDAPLAPLWPTSASLR